MQTQRENSRSERNISSNNNPPPLPVKSRFSAAAEMDRDIKFNNDNESSTQLPPPQPVESRFAAIFFY